MAGARPRTIGRVQQESAGAQDLQDAVDSLAQKIPQFWWTKGSLLTISFTASTLDQTVAHKLGGSASGTVVVDLLGNATVYRDTVSDSKLSGSHIRMVASAACTVKIWAWR
jgi:hypothetical protein